MWTFRGVGVLFSKRRDDNSVPVCDVMTPRGGRPPTGPGIMGVRVERDRDTGEVARRTRAWDTPWVGRRIVVNSGENTVKAVVRPVDVSRDRRHDMGRGGAKGGTPFDLSASIEIAETRD